MIVTHSENTCKVLIKNELSEIASIAKAIQELAGQWNLPVKVANQINLVVEEAVSNIIFYAYADAAEHTIQLEFCYQQNRLIIYIIDDGKKFNVLDAAQPIHIHANANEREVGGLGIHLLKTLINTIEYTRDGDNNVLKLIKNI